LTYRILVTPKAQRQIKALPASIQQKVRSAVRGLRENPYPPGVKKLESRSDFYRIRVSDYRIVYGIEEQNLVLLVVTVGHRKDVYDKLSKKYNRQYLLSLIRGEK
jgi:mRNA interferase RelE/StbE